MLEASRGSFRGAQLQPSFAVLEVLPLVGGEVWQLLVLQNISFASANNTTDTVCDQTGFAFAPFGS